MAKAGCPQLKWMPDLHVRDPKSIQQGIVSQIGSAFITNRSMRKMDIQNRSSKLSIFRLDFIYIHSGIIRWVMN